LARNRSLRAFVHGSVAYGDTCRGRVGASSGAERDRRRHRAQRSSRQGTDRASAGAKPNSHSSRAVYRRAAAHRPAALPLVVDETSRHRFRTVSMTSSGPGGTPNPIPVAQRPVAPSAAPATLVLNAAVLSSCRHRRTSWVRGLTTAACWTGRGAGPTAAGRGPPRQSRARCASPSPSRCWSPRDAAGRSSPSRPSACAECVRLHSTTGRSRRRRYGRSVTMS